MFSRERSDALLYGKHCFVPVEAMTYITVCVVLCCDSGKWNSLTNEVSCVAYENISIRISIRLIIYKVMFPI